MFKGVRQFLNLFRTVKVRSLDSFVVFLKHLGCTSVVGEIAVIDVFNCSLSLSARSEDGRRVIFTKDFFVTEGLGTPQDLKNLGKRQEISERLLILLKADFVKFVHELCVPRVAFVDLVGCKWIIHNGDWKRTI